LNLRRLASFRLPANSSRYFMSRAEALAQPTGNMLIQSHQNSGHLFNSLFSEQEIRYDSLYSTVNPFHLIQATKEIESVISGLRGSIFIEIGCGQGELVEWLISIGERAYGFDPVCRTSATYLSPENFSIDRIASEYPSDSRLVFVMRCVLPHITNSFQFITSILDQFPYAKFLMQHQRIEHYCMTSTWTSLMHDHVNIFQLQDFRNYFTVETSSIFCGGEWQQIIISARTGREIMVNQTGIATIERLLSAREEHLKVLATQRSVYFFGAAGKGINFAYACVESGINLQGAIDDSSALNNRYLEGSGVRVSAPGDLSSVKTIGATMIVMNHSHLALAREMFRDFSWIESLHTI